jgi:hypothetical protein
VRFPDGIFLLVSDLNLSKCLGFSSLGVFTH